MTEDKTRAPGTVHRQRARRQWDCAECPDPILKGQSYMFLNTFDERSRAWSRYILCEACERVLNCHRVVELALGEDFPYSAGKMRWDLKELHNASEAYREEFRKAWLASRPVAVTPSGHPE